MVKTENSSPRLFSSFKKNLFSKIAFGLFFTVLVIITLRVSYRIALHRVIDSEHAMDKATEFLMHRRFEEALEQFEKSLKGNPRRKLAWSGKGLCLMSLGRYDEALANYNRLLKMDSSSPHAWLGKAISLENLGKYDEAIESYNKSLKILPTFGLASDQREKLLEKMK